MQRFSSIVVQHVTWKAMLVFLALMMAIINANPRQANGKPKENKKKKPVAFVLFKLLETAAGGGNEPFTDGNAYC